MASGSAIERLSAHKTIQAAPQSEIEWVALRGHERSLEVGEVLTPKEGPVDGLHIILEGNVAIYVDRGAGPKKVMEWQGGDVTGVLPYSRIVAPPADVVAVEPTELVTLLREDLEDLISQCPQLTNILVHVMVDRARHFTSSFLHDEKLVSLGKLSAGLAHELNNPAAAISRSASRLTGQTNELESRSRALGAAGLTAAQLGELESLCDSLLNGTTHSVLSPLEQEAREDAIDDWLARRGASRDVADRLADTPITLDALEAIAGTLPWEMLDPVLGWMASALTLRRLGMEIGEAAQRVSGLVASVKEFSQMDRAGGGEDVDVARGLSTTLSIIAAKARQKSVAIRLDIEPDLPGVRGQAGELNQVWSNLIDNAIDAAPEQGHVGVIARSEGGEVVVRVVDDGPGIPADIRDRVFDPFFTTKPVGAGTGLGLDIARRLIQRHGGRIEVESDGEGTRFQVRLPRVSAGSPT